MAVAKKQQDNSLNIERTIKTLQQTEASLQKTVTSLNNTVAETVQSLVDITEKIEDKKVELASLEVELSQTKSDKDYELKVAVRDNRKATLITLLNEEGLAEIPKLELHTLYQDLANANRNIEQEIQQEVEEAVKDLHNQFDIVKLNLESQHRIDIAELKAELSSLQTSVKMYKEQAENYKSQIEADREARIAIAESESNKQGVTVNTGK